MIYEINYNDILNGIAYPTSEFVRANNEKEAIAIAQNVLGISENQVCYCYEVKTIN